MTAVRKRHSAACCCPCPYPAPGLTGSTGPTGETGTTATINVGSVTTGEPGTEGQGTNSGDENNAILDFVFPRGEPGGGTPEVLATVGTTGYLSEDGQVLTFNDTPLVSGSAITHQAGSPNVVINQSGIDQATFHGTVAVNPSTAIPSSIDIQLLENGVAVPGTVTSHSFASINEVATMSFSVPFREDAVPANITVTANQDGFQFNEVTLTIIGLGDATTR